MQLIILDRDGVINQDSDAYVKNADEWVPIEGSIDAIARRSNAGFTIAVATKHEIVLAIVGVLTSVISAYYYLAVVREMFFSDPEANTEPVQYGFPLQITVALTLAATLIMNIYPIPFLELIGRPSELFTQALNMLFL